MSAVIVIMVVVVMIAVVAVVMGKVSVWDAALIKVVTVVAVLIIDTLPRVETTAVAMFVIAFEFEGAVS